jgi:hypothetical protein
MRAAPAFILMLVAAAAGSPGCHRRPPASEAPATPAGSSGVPGTLRLRDLDADQRRAVCDWTARQYGGYGTTAPCGDRGQYASRVPKNQLSCVTSFERIRCDVTVAQVEACTLAAAKDVCRSVLTPPPECNINGC